MQLAQTLIDMQLEKNQSEKEALERQHQLETEVDHNVKYVCRLHVPISWI